MKSFKKKRLVVRLSAIQANLELEGRDVAASVLQEAIEYVESTIRPPRRYNLTPETRERKRRKQQEAMREYWRNRKAADAGQIADIVAA